MGTSYGHESRWFRCLAWFKQRSPQLNPFHRTTQSLPNVVQPVHVASTRPMLRSQTSPNQVASHDSLTTTSTRGTSGDGSETEECPHQLPMSRSSIFLTEEVDGRRGQVVLHKDHSLEVRVPEGTIRIYVNEDNA